MKGIAKTALGVMMGGALLLSGIAGFGATATAGYVAFCPGGIDPHSRCISTSRQYIYGVGAVKISGIGDTYDYPCLGAKQNSDGSGGNAIPFSCFQITYNQTRWTPGGTSGTGYSTIINNDSWRYWVEGITNFA